LRLALATCADLPDWEVDDRPFHAALRARGHEISLPVWDDARVDWSAFDGVLVRTTWDYMEKQEAFVAWAERVAAVVPLFAPPEVVRWNTRKTYLRELAEEGVPVAPTLWLEAGPPADVAALLDGRGWERGFLKPVVGATARETLRFRTDPAGLAAAQAHLDRAQPREGFLLQPYLPAIEEEGELSAVFFGGRFSHGVRKVPVPGDYRAQDDFGAHDEPWVFSAEERDHAASVLARAERRFGPLLYGRVDFLRGADGRLLLNELELVEPSLFFRHDPQAADRLADAWLARLAAQEIPR
jgi:hypothetical protein